MEAKISNIMMMTMASAALTLALTAGSCTEGEESPEDKSAQDSLATSIATGQNAFSFGSKGIERYSLSVENATEWGVRNEASWVRAEKQADNTLRITVSPSRSPFDRTATLAVVATDTALGEATFTVTQAHGTPTLYIRQLTGGISARHSSENGLWVTGQKSTAVVTVDVTKLSDESYIGVYKSMAAGVHSIDNNGNAYSNGCSADGSIYTDYDTQNAVDNGAGGEFFPARYIPYIMRNNRRINLSYPATYGTSAIAIPGYVTRHMYQGCIPDRMSADGKYIFGRLMNTQNMWFAARWKRVGTSNDYTFKELGESNDGDLNAWDTVYANIEGAQFMTIEPRQFLCAQNVSGLSMYGKYACGHYGSSLSGGGQLFRYDMEADKLELLDAIGIALYVTDDGTLFTGGNKVYKPGSSVAGTLREWLVEKYGSAIADQIGPDVNMGSVSADYATTVLFKLASEEDILPPSYIITVEP